jgi:16S rRNA (guanine(966)-N(2))-methyltransferase RsmD
VRVIAGALKGRRLKAPTWDGLRPTSDKLRETLFNILAPRIAGARVLDGFAGTGAIGIEALSRGAAHVTFIERDRRAQALIADNLAHCGVTDGYVMIRASVSRALADLRAEPFDIMIFDPPYDHQPGARGVAGDPGDPGNPGNIDAVLAAAADRLAPNGLLVLEHARRHAAPESAGRVVRTRQVVSGDSTLSFYS